MTHPVLADALAESSQQIPETVAAVCADLRSGEIVATHIDADAPADARELADAAARVFAGGRKAALNRLWAALGDNAEGGDEVVLLEPGRCLVFLRLPARPHYALAFLSGRAADVGLTIARTRTVKASFDEALRRI